MACVRRFRSAQPGRRRRVSGFGGGRSDRRTSDAIHRRDERISQTAIARQHGVFFTVWDYSVFMLRHPRGNYSARPATFWGVSPVFSGSLGGIYGGEGVQSSMWPRMLQGVKCRLGKTFVSLQCICSVRSSLHKGAPAGFCFTTPKIDGSV